MQLHFDNSREIPTARFGEDVQMVFWHTAQMFHRAHRNERQMENPSNLK